jgi:dTDP-4-amino-4,6-dideoxygalactose transaminase
MIKIINKMSLFREIPPSAGLPLSLKELLPIFGHNKPGQLENDLIEYLKIPYAQITYSGTAAFYIILEALKNISSKKTVVIPSFICPLVPLAIIRAGLKVLVCDIEKNSFNFQAERLEGICSKNNDILSILALHLGGIPTDFDSIKKLAEKNGIFIIEDCAQSLGATYQGKPTGSLGDFSFFSLCRGKGLTIYEGGVITSKPEFATLIRETAKQIIKDDFLSEGLKILELFGYWIFYRPLLFWFVFRLPQLFWEMQGKTEKAFIEYFSSDFPLHRVSERRKNIGHREFPRLNQEITKQREKATYYLNRLNGIAGIKIIAESRDSYSNYPYLTLIFEQPLERNQALDIFKNSGLGVSRIYLSAITDYTYLKNIYAPQGCSNARSLAERHITLSTSAFLKYKELDTIIERIISLSKTKN